MEGAYRAKDELLTVRETEVQQIPLLRTELEQLKVRKGYSFPYMAESTIAMITGECGGGEGSE